MIRETGDAGRKKQLVVTGVKPASLALALGIPVGASVTGLNGQALASTPESQMQKIRSALMSTDRVS